MNLTRKIGPLPLWAWAVITLVVGYVLYKRFASTGSSGATVPQNASQPATDSSGALGLTPTAGSPTDTGQTTSDLVSALGGQQASLLDALEAKNQDVLALAQSQIAAATSSGISPSSTTETQPATGSQPGGSNAPIYVYVSPTATNTPTSPAAAAAAKVTSTQTKPTRYYTYKNQVPLGPGQKLRFLSGKGYYAA